MISMMARISFLLIHRTSTCALNLRPSQKMSARRKCSDTSLARPDATWFPGPDRCSAQGAGLSNESTRNSATVVIVGMDSRISRERNFALERVASKDVSTTIIFAIIVVAPSETSFKRGLRERTHGSSAEYQLTRATSLSSRVCTDDNASFGLQKTLHD